MPGFTKKAIKTTFIKLLGERPLNQITVKDIVETCGINRNSFYYHFNDIPSLIDEIINETVDFIAKEYRPSRSIRRSIEVTVTFSLEHKKEVLHLFNSSSKDVVEYYLSKLLHRVACERVDHLCLDSNISDTDKSLIVEIYENECYGLITGWLRDGMTYDVMTRFDRLFEICNGMTEEAVRRCDRTKSLEISLTVFKGSSKS